MDRERVREHESRCTEEQPPPCAAACPVHLDGRALAEKVKAGDFEGGFAVLARALPLARVLGRICDHPCEPACERAAIDAPVQLHELERACAERAAPVRPQRAPARKQQRVAIAGAGPSGLAAAAELARRGYPVLVFEAAERPGGRLLELPRELLPEEALAAELAALEALGVELRCGAPVGASGDAPSLATLEDEFAAVYVATGAGAALSLRAAGEGAREIDPATLAAGAKRFAGGGLRRAAGRWSPIASVTDGREAAISIDRLLQGASLTAGRAPPGPAVSQLHVDRSSARPAPAIHPQDERWGWTAAEASAEAGRCLPCRCLACVKACEYLAHFGSYPKRYVREIDNNDCIVMGQHKANHLVNSCALCGLCAELCPGGLSMAEVCSEARRSLVAKGKMPPSAHEFALRELAFDTSDAFALARHAPGASASAALFFPGCQLAGSSPELVTRIWRHLRARIPGGVGLQLGCCGAPAAWAGRADLLEGMTAGIAADWARLGDPLVIAACPSCQRAFAGRFPQARVRSLWTVLAETGLPAGATRLDGRALAVHDPCAARHDTAVQDAVRQLLEKLGATVLELPGNRERTSCCSYGGLMQFANPELATKVVARRIGESPADYVSCCAGCRDNFAAQGKRSLHLLDLVCGAPGDPAARPAPSFSERREARARLKRTLLAAEWGEAQPEPEAQWQLRLRPAVAALLQQRMILEQDVRLVIAQAEASGERFEDPVTGHRIASLRPANVTFWIEYAPAPGGFVLHDAWGHRMDVS